MQIPVVVATFNEGRSQNAQQTLKDFDRIDALRKAHANALFVIMFEELDDDDPAPEMSLLRKELADDFFVTGANTKVPILVSKRVGHHKVDIVSNSFERAHPGKAGISPDRVFQKTLIRVDDFPVFTALGAHAVAGKDVPGVSERAWRQSMWNVWWHKGQDIIQKEQKAGRLVLFGCDANAQVMRPFVAKFRIIARKTIDYVWLLQGKNLVFKPTKAFKKKRADGRAGRLIPMNSDHDLVYTVGVLKTRQTFKERFSKLGRRKKSKKGSHR